MSPLAFFVTIRNRINRSLCERTPRKSCEQIILEPKRHRFVVNTNFVHRSSLLAMIIPLENRFTTLLLHGVPLIYRGLFLHKASIISSSFLGRLSQRYDWM